MYRKEKKMNKANLMIRDALEGCQVPYWRLADLMKIHPSTLSGKLRHELPVEEQTRIVKLIKDGAGRSDREAVTQ